MRVTRNFLPMAGGGMEVRHGAVQLLAGDVTGAAAWGRRLVAECNGRLVVVMGRTVQDVGPAGRFLRASAFQALTQDAQRENRLYVADGVRPLWYLAFRDGGIVREAVVNTVLDASGLPYPLPVPSLVATWRGRLWVDEGRNRLRHCQFDRPAEWDPLWTVEMQAADSDRLLALVPAGDVLLVGLHESVWAVSGNSQYDWRTQAVVTGRGCGGPQSMVVVGQQAVWAARDGVFSLGVDVPLSGDVREAFGVPFVDVSVAAQARERRLYVRVGGRVLVLHLDSQRWGELAADNVRGLFTLDGRVGWYGPDGAWVLAGFDSPDVALDGTHTPVDAVLESWDEVPNRGGGGRALLNRVRFYVQGSPRGDATYTVTVDGVRTFSGSLSLSDVAVDTWQAAVPPADGTGQAWPPPGVFREMVPRLSGSAFRHRFEAPCYMRLDGFSPEFRFAAGP